MISSSKFKSGHKLIARYLVAGSIGASVNIASMYVFTSIMGVWYIASAMLSFLTSLCVTFFLQKMWTFKDPLLNSRHAGKQAILYTTASVSFLVINTVMLYFLVEFIGMGYILAQFISLGSVSVGSFLFNSAVTFQNHGFSVWK